MLNPNCVRYRAAPQRLQRGGHWILNSGYRSCWCDVKATPWIAFMRSQNGFTQAGSPDPSHRPTP
jgi:hypothetical protein